MILFTTCVLVQFRIVGDSNRVLSSSFKAIFASHVVNFVIETLHYGAFYRKADASMASIICDL